MKTHDKSVTECPDKNIKIPSAYAEDLRKGTPALFLFTIGYSGHGKTCYLSSLFHTLYHGGISRRWPGFSFIGLTMETLNKIHQDYVNILEQGRLPAKSPIMFPTPLILKLQKLPVRIRRLFIGSTIKQKDIILVFYDVGGGTFELDEKIRQNLPILREINTLIFLIDLPGIINEAQIGTSVIQRMHNLLSTVYLAVSELGQNKKKNIILCFTKSDLMWGKENIYGPLARRLRHDVPSIDELVNYLDLLRRHSDNIHKFVHQKYTSFYNALVNNFNFVCFASLSSLGTQPRGDAIPVLAPSNVLDPILWTLRSEGYL